MIATIKLENIQIYAFHGCYKEEQQVGNRFRVDLSLKYNASEASQSDFVEDAVNYLKVYECIHEQMMQTSHILEHVVRRILDALGYNFPQIKWAEVSVAKLSPPLGGHVEAVSLTVERNYSDF